MKQLFINIFKIIFPIFLTIALIRFVTNAHGDFNLRLFVEYSKSHFDVSFTDFVTNLRYFTDIMKGLQWSNFTTLVNPRDFWTYNIFQWAEFFGGFKEFLIYSSNLVFIYIKNIFTIIYCIFGYIAFIVRYFINLLLTIFDILTFVFGLQSV